MLHTSDLLLGNTNQSCIIKGILIHVLIYIIYQLRPLSLSRDPKDSSDSIHLESDEGDLHGQDGAQAVYGAVSHVDAVRESPGEHQHQDVQGDQVDEEHVASPR